MQNLVTDVHLIYLDVGSPISSKNNNKVVIPNTDDTSSTARFLGME